jgi:hypothetical protein
LAHRTTPSVSNIWLSIIKLNKFYKLFQKQGL